MRYKISTSNHCWNGINALMKFKSRSCGNFKSDHVFWDKVTHIFFPFLHDRVFIISIYTFNFSIIIDIAIIISTRSSCSLPWTIWPWFNSLLVSWWWRFSSSPRTSLILLICNLFLFNFWSQIINFNSFTCIISIYFMLCSYCFLCGYILCPV